MKESVGITIPSHPKYLCIVRKTTSAVGELYGIPDTDLEDIKLAIDEACSNVIKHAYGGDATKKIVVKYTVTKNLFKVIIEDSGIKAQIEFMQGRSLNDVRPGGLGIHFIRRVFDGLRFDEKKKKGNRLILSKTLKVEE
jgi:anti-sigma regulatory factor (Ser/Thr protein kinase)